MQAAAASSFSCDFLGMWPDESIKSHHESFAEVPEDADGVQDQKRTL